MGTWTVVVKDTVVNDKSGTFIDWHLKLWGEAIDPNIATLIPLPTEADDNHDQIATTTIAATVTSISLLPTDNPSFTNPTDHPDRPINAKPTGSLEDETSSSPTTSTISTSVPQATATESSWLPSFFPTFGVSQRTQVWIYGSLALIVIFCSGLGIYLYVARRQRLRNSSRDNYEFDLIADDEADGLARGRVPGANVRRSNRRAGELYDAFAAGSEDEEEGFSGDEGRVYTEKDRGKYVGENDEEGLDLEENGEESAKKNLLNKK